MTNMLTLLIPRRFLPMWWRRHRDRGRCFHHDHTTGRSWISARLVDLGRAKHYRCIRCGRYWT